MHAHTCTHTHTHAHTHTHTHTHTCTYVHTHTRTYVHTHTHIHTLYYSVFSPTHTAIHAHKHVHAHSQERKNQLLDALNEYICRQIDCAEFESTGSIECNGSKSGVYTATLTGVHAEQQVRNLAQRTDVELILPDGVVLRVKVSDGKPGPTVASQSQGPDNGGEIAAGIVIAVVILSVVAVAVAVTVILYKCKLR